MPNGPSPIAKSSHGPAGFSATGLSPTQPSKMLGVPPQIHSRPDGDRPISVLAFASSSSKVSPCGLGRSGPGGGTSDPNSHWPQHTGPYPALMPHWLYQPMLRFESVGTIGTAVGTKT